MDKNYFFYDKLKHNDFVQKFLKNADSMISCSKCSNNISDSIIVVNVVKIVS